MKKFVYLFVFLCLCAVHSAYSQGKQNVSVLYVGGSADIETMGAQNIDSLVLKKSIKARMNAYETFLKSRFKKVKMIDAKAYVAILSDQYDVTIFDGDPVPIRPMILERDANGRTTRYERAAYLPDDFSRPSICIANFSEDIGRSIGTKNDWYCLCLDADAHHWVKDHPIFQGPFKVNIQTEMKPTPPSAFEYTEIYNYTLPEQTEMWTVQTKSMQSDPNHRIGMVSRPEGYLDSPETEVISSGVCAKSIDAVAIGRHANFFHWGFSASPANLTEAGKAAFANAIVYISQFAGQRVIARKKNESIATRKSVDLMKYLASRDAWEAVNRNNWKSYQTIDSVQKVVRAKQAKGEKLEPTEQFYLNIPLQRPQDKTYAEYMKDRNPKLYHLFGNEEEEYQRFYDKNRKWFHPEADGYSLDIDEDVRTLGIANNDIRLIDTCISMLEKGEVVELATRVLHRYTLCRFATPIEWRQWFDAYKEKMFFTESGGWLWLINTLDRNVPGNDYSILNKTAETAKVPELKGDTDKQNPVAFSAAIHTLEDGSKELAIRMKIHTGYHTYAQVSEKEPFVPTSVEIILPKGYKLEGALATPIFTKQDGTSTTIYTGDSVFRQKISGKGAGEVKCAITYQCCDHSICFPPETKELTVKLL